MANFEYFVDGIKKLNITSEEDKKFFKYLCKIALETLEQTKRNKEDAKTDLADDDSNTQQRELLESEIQKLQHTIDTVTEINTRLGSADSPAQLNEDFIKNFASKFRSVRYLAYVLSDAPQQVKGLQTQLYGKMLARLTHSEQFAQMQSLSTENLKDMIQSALERYDSADTPQQEKLEAQKIIHLAYYEITRKYCELAKTNKEQSKEEYLEFLQEVQKVLPNLNDSHKKSNVIDNLDELKGPEGKTIIDLLADVEAHCNINKFSKQYWESNIPLQYHKLMHQLRIGQEGRRAYATKLLENMERDLFWARDIRDIKLFTEDEDADKAFCEAEERKYIDSRGDIGHEAHKDNEHLYDTKIDQTDTYDESLSEQIFSIAFSRARNAQRDAAAGAATPRSKISEFSRLQTALGNIKYILNVFNDGLIAVSVVEVDKNASLQSVFGKTQRDSGLLNRNLHDMFATSKGNKDFLKLKTVKGRNLEEIESKLRKTTPQTEEIKEVIKQISNERYRMLIKKRMGVSPKNDDELQKLTKILQYQYQVLRGDLKQPDPSSPVIKFTSKIQDALSNKNYQELIDNYDKYEKYIEMHQYYDLLRKQYGNDSSFKHINTGINQIDWSENPQQLRVLFKILCLKFHKPQVSFNQKIQNPWIQLVTAGAPIIPDNNYISEFFSRTKNLALNKIEKVLDTKIRDNDIASTSASINALKANPTFEEVQGAIDWLASEGQLSQTQEPLSIKDLQLNPQEELSFRKLLSLQELKSYYKGQLGIPESLEVGNPKQRVTDIINEALQKIENSEYKKSIEDQNLEAAVQKALEQLAQNPLPGDKSTRAYKILQKIKTINNSSEERQRVSKSLNELLEDPQANKEKIKAIYKQEYQQMYELLYGKSNKDARDKINKEIDDFIDDAIELNTRVKNGEPAVSDDEYNSYIDVIKKIYEQYDSDNIVSFKIHHCKKGSQPKVEVKLKGEEATRIVSISGVRTKIPYSVSKPPGQTSLILSYGGSRGVVAPFSSFDEVYLGKRQDEKRFFTHSRLLGVGQYGSIKAVESFLTGLNDSIIKKGYTAEAYDKRFRDDPLTRDITARRDPLYKVEVDVLQHLAKARLLSQDSSAEESTTTSWTKTKQDRRKTTTGYSKQSVVKPQANRAVSRLSTRADTYPLRPFTASKPSSDSKTQYQILAERAKGESFADTQVKVIKQFTKAEDAYHNPLARGADANQWLGELSRNLSLSQAVVEEAQNFENLGFAHNDIKPENFLYKQKLDGSFDVKYIDWATGGFELQLEVKGDKELTEIYKEQFGTDFPSGDCLQNIEGYIEDKNGRFVKKNGDVYSFGINPQLEISHGARNATLPYIHPGIARESRRKAEQVDTKLDNKDQKMDNWALTAMTFGICNRQAYFEIVKGRAINDYIVPGAIEPDGDVKNPGLKATEPGFTKLFACGDDETVMYIPGNKREGEPLHLYRFLKELSNNLEKKESPAAQEIKQKIDHVLSVVYQSIANSKGLTKEELQQNLVSAREAVQAYHKLEHNKEMSLTRSRADIFNDVVKDSKGKDASWLNSKQPGAELQNIYVLATYPTTKEQVEEAKQVLRDVLGAAIKDKVLSESKTFGDLFIQVIENNQPEILQTLIELVDENRLNQEFYNLAREQCLIQYALQEGQTNSARMMLDCCNKYSNGNTYGLLMLDTATDTWQTKLQWRANAFYYAISNQNVEQLNLILDNMPDVDVNDLPEELKQAMHLSASLGNVEFFNKIKEKIGEISVETIENIKYPPDNLNPYLLFMRDSEASSKGIDWTGLAADSEAAKAFIHQQKPLLIAAKNANNTGVEKVIELAVKVLRPDELEKLFLQTDASGKNILNHILETKNYALLEKLRDTIDENCQDKKSAIFTNLLLRPIKQQPLYDFLGQDGVGDFGEQCKYLELLFKQISHTKPHNQEEQNNLITLVLSISDWIIQKAENSENHAKLADLLYGALHLQDIHKKKLYQELLSQCPEANPNARDFIESQLLDTVKNASDKSVQQIDISEILEALLNLGTGDKQHVQTHEIQTQTDNGDESLLGNVADLLAELKEHRKDKKWRETKSQEISELVSDILKKFEEIEGELDSISKDIDQIDGEQEIRTTIAKINDKKLAIETQKYNGTELQKISTAIGIDLRRLDELSQQYENLKEKSATISERAENKLTEILNENAEKDYAEIKENYSALLRKAASEDSENIDSLEPHTDLMQIYKRIDNFRQRHREIISRTSGDEESWDKKINELMGNLRIINSDIVDKLVEEQESLREKNSALQTQQRRAGMANEDSRSKQTLTYEKLAREKENAIKEAKSAQELLERRQNEATRKLLDEVSKSIESEWESDVEQRVRALNKAKRSLDFRKEEIDNSPLTEQQKSLLSQQYIEVYEKLKSAQEELITFVNERNQALGETGDKAEAGLKADKKEINKLYRDLKQLELVKGVNIGDDLDNPADKLRGRLKEIRAEAIKETNTNSLVRSLMSLKRQLEEINRALEEELSSDIIDHADETEINFWPEKLRGYQERIKLLSEQIPKESLEGEAQGLKTSIETIHNEIKIVKKRNDCKNRIESLASYYLESIPDVNLSDDPQLLYEKLQSAREFLVKITLINHTASRLDDNFASKLEEITQSANEKLNTLEQAYKSSLEKEHQQALENKEATVSRTTRLQTSFAQASNGIEDINKQVLELEKDLADKDIPELLQIAGKHNLLSIKLKEYSRQLQENIKEANREPKVELKNSNQVLMSIQGARDSLRQLNVKITQLTKDKTEAEKATITAQAKVDVAQLKLQALGKQIQESQNKLMPDKNLETHLDIAEAIVCYKNAKEEHGKYAGELERIAAEESLTSAKQGVKESLDTFNRDTANKRRKIYKALTKLGEEIGELLKRDTGGISTEIKLKNVEKALQLAEVKASFMEQLTGNERDNVLVKTCKERVERYQKQLAADVEREFGAEKSQAVDAAREKAVKEVRDENFNRRIAELTRDYEALKEEPDREGITAGSLQSISIRLDILRNNILHLEEGDNKNTVLSQLLNDIDELKTAVDTKIAINATINIDMSSRLADEVRREIAEIRENAAIRENELTGNLEILKETKRAQDASLGMAAEDGRSGRAGAKQRQDELEAKQAELRENIERKSAMMSEELRSRLADSRERIASLESRIKSLSDSESNLGRIKEEIEHCYTNLQEQSQADDVGIETLKMVNSTLTNLAGVVNVLPEKDKQEQLQKITELMTEVNGRIRALEVRKETQSPSHSDEGVQTEATSTSDAESQVDVSESISSQVVQTEVYDSSGLSSEYDENESPRETLPPERQDDESVPRRVKLPSPESPPAKPEFLTLNDDLLSDEAETKNANSSEAGTQAGASPQEEPKKDASSQTKKEKTEVKIFARKGDNKGLTPHGKGYVEGIISSINFPKSKTLTISKAHMFLFEQRGLSVRAPSGHNYTLRAGDEGRLPQAVLKRDGVPKGEYPSDEDKHRQKLAVTMINMIENVLARGTVVNIKTNDPFLMQIGRRYIQYLHEEVKLRIDEDTSTSYLVKNDEVIQGKIEQQVEDVIGALKGKGYFNVDKTLEQDWYKQALDVREGKKLPTIMKPSGS